MSNICCHDVPQLGRAYLEIRDQTWHVKLSPTPEKVKAIPPVAERDGQRFEFKIQIRDAQTGIALDADQTLIIRTRGSIELTLVVVPQAKFQAQRISWNIEFPCDRYAQTSCAWKRGRQSQGTLQFPREQAPAPHLASDFDWLRLNSGNGPIDIDFTTEGANRKQLPVENLLEDLRWWNEPTFWIANSVPYPRQDNRADKPCLVEPGSDITLRVTIQLHCNGGR